MDTTVARTPRSTRSLLIALAGFFLAATIGCASLAIFEAGPGASITWPLVAALFCAAWFIFSSWAVAASVATYEADDLGLTRSGWRATSSIAWNEIGHYRIRTFAGDLTFVFFDHGGRRRASIDFQLLGEGGDELFRFTMAKLAQVLPDCDHECAAQRYRRARSRAGLPRDTEARSRTLRHAASGYFVLAVFFGLGGAFVGLSRGSDLLRDLRLLRQGRQVTGRVIALGDRHQRLLYAFSAPGVGVCAGEVQISHGTARHPGPGDPIAVCYLANDVQTHAPKASLPRRSLYRPLFDSIIFLCGAVFLFNRRAWLLRQLREQSAAGAW